MVEGASMNSLQKQEKKHPLEIKAIKEKWKALYPGVKIYFTKGKLGGFRLMWKYGEHWGTQNCTAYSPVFLKVAEERLEYEFKRYAVSFFLKRGNYE